MENPSSQDRKEADRERDKVKRGERRNRSRYSAAHRVNGSVGVDHVLPSVTGPPVRLVGAGDAPTVGSGRGAAREGTDGGRGVAIETESLAAGNGGTVGRAGSPITTKRRDDLGAERGADLGAGRGGDLAVERADVRGARTGMSGEVECGGIFHSVALSVSSSGPAAVSAGGRGAAMGGPGGPAAGTGTRGRQAVRWCMSD